MSFSLSERPAQLSNPNHTMTMKDKILQDCLGVEYQVFFKSISNKKKEKKRLTMSHSVLMTLPSDIILCSCHRSLQQDHYNFEQKTLNLSSISCINEKSNTEKQNKTDKETKNQNRQSNHVFLSLCGCRMFYNSCSIDVVRISHLFCSALSASPAAFTTLNINFSYQFKCLPQMERCCHCCTYSPSM